MHCAVPGTLHPGSAGLIAQLIPTTTGARLYSGLWIPASIPFRTEHRVGVMGLMNHDCGDIESRLLARATALRDCQAQLERDRGT